MTNIGFIIPFGSIRMLTIKYVIDLKSNKYLLATLILLGMPSLGFILNFIFGFPTLFSLSLLAGMVLAPIVFSIHLLKKVLVVKKK